MNEVIYAVGLVASVLLVVTLFLGVLLNLMAWLDKRAEDRARCPEWASYPSGFEPRTFIRERCVRRNDGHEDHVLFGGFRWSTQVNA